MEVRYERAVLIRKRCRGFKNIPYCKVSFGKAGFVFIDPAKSFSGMPNKGIPSMEGSYLNFIYVRPDHRRKGLGEKMLRKVMEQYPSLWGIAGSPEGAALMQKCGIRYF